MLRDQLQRAINLSKEIETQAELSGRGENNFAIVFLVISKTLIVENRCGRNAIGCEDHSVPAAVELDPLPHGMSSV